MGLADISAHAQPGRRGAARATMRSPELAPLVDAPRRRGGARGREPGRRARRRSSGAPRAHLRYAGTDTALEVALGARRRDARALSRRRTRARFGFVDRRQAAGRSRRSRSRRSAARRASPSAPAPIDRDAPPPRPPRATRFFSHGAWREADVFRREALALGARVAGPALIIEPHQTIVVEPGWRRGDHGARTTSC